MKCGEHVLFWVACLTTEMLRVGVGKVGGWFKYLTALSEILLYHININCEAVWRCSAINVCHACAVGKMSSVRQLCGELSQERATLWGPTVGKEELRTRESCSMSQERIAEDRGIFKSLCACIITQNNVRFIIQVNVILRKKKKKTN